MDRDGRQHILVSTKRTFVECWVNVCMHGMTGQHRIAVQSGRRHLIAARCNQQDYFCAWLFLCLQHRGMFALYGDSMPTTVWHYICTPFNLVRCICRLQCQLVHSQVDCWLQAQLPATQCCQPHHFQHVGGWQSDTRLWRQAGPQPVTLQELLHRLEAHLVRSATACRSSCSNSSTRTRVAVQHCWQRQQPACRSNGSRVSSQT